MACLMGLMLICFTLGGLFLLAQGARVLALTARRAPHLARAQGMVKRVERDTRPRGVKAGGRGESRFVPIVIFTDREGRVVEFRSEIGDIGRTSRYRTGQYVPVAYDPAGQLPPRVDSWFALWGPPLALAAGGLLFLTGAAMVWLAFGERLLGG